MLIPFRFWTQCQTTFCIFVVYGVLSDSDTVLTRPLPASRITGIVRSPITTIEIEIMTNAQRNPGALHHVAQACIEASHLRGYQFTFSSDPKTPEELTILYTDPGEEPTPEFKASEGTILDLPGWLETLKKTAP